MLCSPLTLNCSELACVNPCFVFWTCFSLSRAVSSFLFSLIPFPRPFPLGSITAAHSAQETHLLTRLPIYYKRIQPRNSQMEEMHRAGYGERAWSFHALSEFATLPKSLLVYHPRNSQNLVFWFLWRHDWLNHWPLAIEVGGGETKSPNSLITWLA